MKSPQDPVFFLLVDDLDENLLALEGLLRRDGLTLLKARNGSQALELLLKHDVALALLDVQMPGMDGFELAELMRGTQRTRRVPIIFLTAGAADSQRRFRGYEAGAVDFLFKPIEPHILRSKADVFFELYRQRQEVATQRDELQAATEENARLLEASRLQAAALRDADQRKDEFLAMLAHELRNPLAPISNAVEILRLTYSDDHGIREAHGIIARQVQHMSRLVDDLLDVARIARGKIELRSAPCDLGQIARETANDYAPLLAAAGVELNIHVPPEPLLVFGDKTRLAQIVGNVLHNASKFTPRGGKVNVATTFTDSTATIAIQDTGAGLDQAFLSHIFEPFGQINQSLDRAKGGLGLGLALAKGLAELHHGKLLAESPGVGQGSTFTLTIPLLGTTVRSVASAVELPPKSEPSLRIVVVEDNRDAAISLQRVLTMRGHVVQVAFDGVSGIEAANQMRPQVVISDLGLPGEIDGFALAKQIKSQTGSANVYLIALSGYGRDEDRQHAADAGFDKHFVKPIDYAALNSVLQSLKA